MPNTLAHLGVHALVSRLGWSQSERAWRDRDLWGWVWLGAVIPDLPWILQRGVRAAMPAIPALDLRLYAIVQSALIFCLIAAAAAAVLSRHPWRAFGVLAVGAVVHLLLDASQTKWGNGVILFAPVDWSVWTAALYWPEDWPTAVLSASGAAGVLLAGVVAWQAGGPRPWRWPRGRAWAAATALALVYALGPFLLMGQAERSDPHFLATLRAVEARAGKPVAFDRSRVVVAADGQAVLYPWTREALVLTGVALPPGRWQISLRGRFEAPGVIAVEALHRHRAGWREAATALGLILVLAWWLWAPARWVWRTARGNSAKIG